MLRREALRARKNLVFSIAVSNTDDHLRNHGFLLGERGWRLSPVYDLNPNPEGNGLSLNINMDDNSLDFDLAMEVIPFFRIGAKEAKGILEHIQAVVGGWRDYASRTGISKGEMDLMAPAFDRVEARHT